MIGRTVRSRPVSVLGAVLLLCIGLGVAAAGPLTAMTWPPVAAVLPLTLGGAFLVMGRERTFSATFTVDAIEIGDPPSSIRYDQIRYVWANGLAHDPGSFSKSSSVIHVEHDGGMIRIPGRLDHPSSQVYTFLASQVPLRGGRAVNLALAEYLEREESDCGPDQVWTYTMSAHRRRRLGDRRLRIVCVGVLITGAVWLALGLCGKAEFGWGIAGVIAVIAGGLILLSTRLGNDLLVARGLKHSSLVIGPRGMAMVQGDVQGEMCWPEVLEVRYAPRPFALWSSNYQSPGMPFSRIRVKGADIRVLDIYERPLYVILGRIMACSGAAGKGVGRDPSP